MYIQLLARLAKAMITTVINAPDAVQCCMSVDRELHLSVNT